MDRKGIKKHKEVFDAWLNGAEVEYKDLGGEWRTVKEPQFSSIVKYRVKPEACTTLLNDGDVVQIKRNLCHDPNVTNICKAKLIITAKLIPENGNLKTVFTPKLCKGGIEVLPVIPFPFLDRPEVSLEDLEIHYELEFQKVSCR